jgi:hypothetical protein
MQGKDFANRSRRSATANRIRRKAHGAATIAATVNGQVTDKRMANSFNVGGRLTNTAGTIVLPWGSFSG